IPDIEADRKATPIKRTSVVWFVDKFGMRFASFPAALYFVTAALWSIWLFSDRLWTGVIVMVLLIVAVFFVFKIQPNKLQQVTNIEKILLLIAMVIAIVLGVF